jgi:hypothetical protein
MAITLQDGNLVWQKVNKALAGSNPAIQEAFRNLKVYMATQKGNPQLTFLPFSAEQAIANNGTDLAGQAVTVYGWYAKGRRTTGTTSSFLATHAAADNTATTTTLVTSRFKAVGQEFGFVNPFGLACETGLTISAATAVGGPTESATADAADGFYVVGS